MSESHEREVAVLLKRLADHGLDAPLNRYGIFAQGSQGFVSHQWNHLQTAHIHYISRVLSYTSIATSDTWEERAWEGMKVVPIMEYISGSQTLGEWSTLNRPIHGVAMLSEWLGYFGFTPDGLVEVLDPMHTEGNYTLQAIAQGFGFRR